MGVGFGSVWVTDHGQPTLVRIDAATASVTAKVEQVALNVAIAVTENAVWTATRTGVAQVSPAMNAVGKRIELGLSEYYGATFVAGRLWVTDTARSQVFELVP